MATVYSKKINLVAVTVGDINGIGLEVTAKAIAEIRPSLKKLKSLFVVFRHKKQSSLQPKYFKLFDQCSKRLVFFSLEEALLFLKKTDIKKISDRTIIDLALDSSEADWVFAAAQACARGDLVSMTTGPLSKKIGALLPKKPLGHTGIFRHMYPKSPLHMCFVGQFFNVILSTDHIPLSRVEKTLADGALESSLASAYQFRRIFKDKRKVAVLGLNPHSGEGSLIGDFEKKHLKIYRAKHVEGPIVPDAAFLKKNWKRYSVFVCPYHDQGLIPFKSQHGQDSGVHITLGLPFLRTSVDHGTAFDLFNKDCANPNSMKEALLLNIRLRGAPNA